MKPSIAEQYDLGGVGHVEGWTTVNLCAPCDIQQDILDFDRPASAICLSHTLEHVPLSEYEGFLKRMVGLLVPSGKLIVRQTDIGRVAQMYAREEISFDTFAACTFTPPQRLRRSMLMEHKSMHCMETMEKELSQLGLQVIHSEINYWSFDMFEKDYETLERDYNLGASIPEFTVTAISSG